MSAVVDTKTVYFCSNDREIKYRENLLQNGTNADCEFLVGPTETKFSCHRLFLISASEKMESLLKNATGPIKINDLDADVFSELLKAIYYYRITLGSIDFAFKLAKAAKEYGLTSVRAHCLNFMSNSKGINLDTVLSILEVGSADGVDTSEDNVKNECWKLIRGSTESILTSHAFLKAKPETVASIFSDDQLKVHAELDLVDALHKYAIFNNALPICSGDKSANQQKFEEMVLPSLKHIRFLCIPLNEVYKSAGLAALLSPEIITGISALIIAPESEFHRNHYPENFSNSMELRSKATSMLSVSSSSRASIAYTAEVTASNREQTEIWEEDVVRNGHASNHSVDLSLNKSVLVNGHNVHVDTANQAQSTPNGNYSQLVEKVSDDQIANIGKGLNLKSRAFKPRNMADETWPED